MYKWDRAPLAPIAGHLSPDDTPPPAWRRLAEVAWHLPRMLSGLGPLGPRGPLDGPPALVIPGFLATDRTTMELRRALARAGWRAHPWLLGVNTGAKPNTMDLLQSRLDAIVEEAGQKVLVVGWSLGGMFARQLACRAPESVRAVVTLGSPFSGDPHLNNVWRLYEWVAGHPVDAPPIDRNPAKPPVPTLAIWSRADGIVAPAAAKGLAEESDKAVEFKCNHMAFGVSRTTARQVVDEIKLFLASKPRDAKDSTSPKTAR